MSGELALLSGDVVAAGDMAVVDIQLMGDAAVLQEISLTAAAPAAFRATVRPRYNMIYIIVINLLIIFMPIYLLEFLLYILKFQLYIYSYSSYTLIHILVIY